MANNCYTDYKVVATKEQIEKIINLFNEVKTECGNVWLSDLATRVSIDYDKRNIHVRGHIYYMDEPEDYGDSLMLLSFGTDTAWSACTDFFHIFNTDIFNDELSISYREVECGCEIYCVHDEHNFFDEQYCVQSSENLGDCMDTCFMNASDVIDYWCEKMHVQRHLINDKKMLDYINDYEYEDSDMYFNVYEFVEE